VLALNETFVMKAFPLSSATSELESVIAEWASAQSDPFITIVSPSAVKEFAIETVVTEAAKPTAGEIVGSSITVKLWPTTNVQSVDHEARWQRKYTPADAPLCNAAL
jgi:hypothetical protein